MKTKTFTMLLVLFTLAFFNYLKAQPGRKYLFDKAETSFRNQEYFAASQYYEAYLSYNKPLNEPTGPFAKQKIIKGLKGNNIYYLALFKLAACYRLFNNFTAAEDYYRQLVEARPGAFPEARLWLGICLRANNKSREAMQELSLFLAKGNARHEQISMAEKEMADLRFTQEQYQQKTTDLFTIAESKPAGSVTAAFGPHTQEGNQIMFTAVTKDSVTAASGETTLSYRTALHVAANRSWANGK